MDAQSLGTIGRVSGPVPDETAFVKFKLSEMISTPVPCSIITEIQPRVGLDKICGDRIGGRYQFWKSGC